MPNVIFVEVTASYVNLWINGCFAPKSKGKTLKNSLRGADNNNSKIYRCNENTFFSAEGIHFVCCSSHEESPLASINEKKWFLTRSTSSSFLCFFSAKSLHVLSFGSFSFFFPWSNHRQLASCVHMFPPHLRFIVKNNDVMVVLAQIIFSASFYCDTDSRRGIDSRKPTEVLRCCHRNRQQGIMIRCLVVRVVAPETNAVGAAHFFFFRIVLSEGTGLIVVSFFSFLRWWKWIWGRTLPSFCSPFYMRIDLYLSTRGPKERLWLCVIKRILRSQHFVYSFGKLRQANQKMMLFFVAKSTKKKRVKKKGIAIQYLLWMF